jgi:drug/metabolite transporter (DMT)-like permease
LISTPVALLVLLSALMHAGWNFVVKASADRFMDFTGLVLAAGLVAASLLPWLPVPAAASWPWLLTTTFVHVGYYAMLMRAYRHADLSIAYPLMRGRAALAHLQRRWVFSLLGALLLKEQMGRWRIAGAVLVALGAASIRWG